MSRNLIVLLLLFCFHYSTGQSDNAKKKLDAFLEVAEELRAEARVPGVGMAIVYEGKVLYTGGLGVSNVETEKPVTENSLFFLGSTGKSMTGYIAGQLHDQGLIDWRSQIKNYIPDFALTEPYIADHIYLEDFFSHMSGLERKDELWLGQPVSLYEVFEQTKTLGFTHSMRHEFLYNNHGFVIIGKALQEASGRSWNSLVETHVYKPLGMTSSFSRHQKFLEYEDHVTAYYRDGYTVYPHVNGDNIGPAGGSISTTPKDISKWLTLMSNEGVLNGDTLISPSTFEYLVSPKGMGFTDVCRVKYYSCGFGGSQENGIQILRHSGSLGGSSARFVVSPQLDFGIFILTNVNNDYKALLSDYAEAIFIEDDFERDSEAELGLINKNRFYQFQSKLLDEGIENAREYYETLEYKDFESDMINLANAFTSSDYSEPALFVFKLVIQDHPDSFEAHFEFAKTLEKFDQKERALLVINTAISLDPENEDAQTFLKMLQTK